MRVSTPETTAYDLVRFAPAAGHLSNVATVLGELAEKLEPAALVALAPSYLVPEVQRLGYLLDLLGEHDLAAHLAAWLETRRYRAILLAPGQPIGAAPLDPRWRVVSNADRGGRPVIPRAHITAWRSKAPWATDAQVEQDLVVSRALVEMFSSALVARSLAFRGGTALHKLFFERPGRFSDDIDLVQVAAGAIGPLLDVIRAGLDSWLGEPKRRLGHGRVTLLYRFATTALSCPTDEAQDRDQHT